MERGMGGKMGGKMEMKMEMKMKMKTKRGMKREGRGLVEWDLAVASVRVCMVGFSSFCEGAF